MSACQIDSVLVLGCSCAFVLITFFKLDEIFDTCYTGNCTVKSGTEENS